MTLYLEVETRIGHLQLNNLVGESSVFPPTRFGSHIAPMLWPRKIGVVHDFNLLSP